MQKDTKWLLIVAGAVAAIAATMVLSSSESSVDAVVETALGNTATYRDLLPIVAKYSAKYNVPTALIFAIMQQESGLSMGVFKTNASLEKNSTEIKAGGSQGLMQILLSSAQNLGYEGDAAGLYNPDTGIQYGVVYIRYILDHFGVDPSNVIDIAGYYNDNQPYVSAASSTQTVYVPHVLKYYLHYQPILNAAGYSNPDPNPSAIPSNAGMIDSLLSYL